MGAFVSSETTAVNGQHVTVDLRPSIEGFDTLGTFVIEVALKNIQLCK